MRMSMESSLWCSTIKTFKEWGLETGITSPFNSPDWAGAIIFRHGGPSTFDSVALTHRLRVTTCQALVTNGLSGLLDDLAQHSDMTSIKPRGMGFGTRGHYRLPRQGYLSPFGSGARHVSHPRKSHHSRQRPRRLYGCDLRRARDAGADADRGHPARRPAHHHDRGRELSRLRRRHPGPVADGADAGAGRA